MTTVYVMRAKGTNLVKIGFTAGDVEERRRALQTGCPHELVVELTFAGTVEDERRAHLHYRERRTIGEWFQLIEDEARLVPHFVDKLRENEGLTASAEDLDQLRRRFDEAFGRGHADGSQYAKASIELFCDAVAESAFNPILNGQSNQCLFCGHGAAWMNGNFEGDEDVWSTMLRDSPDTNLGHDRGCPVPWLARAALEIRRGRG